MLGAPPPPTVVGLGVGVVVGIAPTVFPVCGFRIGTVAGVIGFPVTGLRRVAYAEPYGIAPPTYRLRSTGNYQRQPMCTC